MRADPGPLRRLVNYFVRGLALLAPIALTVYVLGWVLTRVDRLVPLGVPGLGLVVVVGIVTLVGFLGSNLITRGLVALVDRTLERLPFVRILYGATRDLFNAFVGEKKRFDRAVAVALSADGAVKALGFITRDDVDELGLPGHAAVYLPQSYNFAGQVLLVPRERITPLTVDSAQAMTFIVSGGIAEG
jgi:uncharacterized membrane protein